MWPIYLYLTSSMGIAVTAAVNAGWSAGLSAFAEAERVRIHRKRRRESKADMCSAKWHVRLTPNSHRESEFPQQAMSALAPKADMCSALLHIRWVNSGHRWIMDGPSGQQIQLDRRV
jgi:hypothetical protein